jgi:hypothetical protein
MKKHLTAAVLFILFAIPVFQVRAARVTDIRWSSEAGKTRVVFQLDAAAKYHVRNTLEPGISVYLLQTELDPQEQPIHVDSQLVKSVTASEVAPGLLEIKLSLKEKAICDVFCTRSPFRVVIDILSAADALRIPLAGSYALGTMSENNGFDDEGAVAASDNVAQEDDSNASATDIRATEDEKPSYFFITQFIREKHETLQSYFDILFIIGLVVISIRISYINKLLKGKTVHENLDFAQTMNSLQINPGERDKKPESEVPKQPEKPNVAQINQIKETRKNRVAQLNSIPKHYRKVYELAERGMDRFAISKKSNIPIGEVNLILDLAQAKLQGKIG